MDTGSLFAFGGILVAVFAIANPVQRFSFRMFVSAEELFQCFLLTFVLIQLPEFAELVMKKSIPAAGQWGIDIASFLVPVVAVFCWLERWWKAELSTENEKLLPELIQVGLREGMMDEIGRVLSRNKSNFKLMTADTVRSIFDPKVVQRLTRSNSYIHLELLSQDEFLTTIQDVFGPTDIVIRDCINSQESPLRSVIIRSYGGYENHKIQEWESGLMQKTVLCPQWYLKVRCDYPLLFSATEAIGSGEFDDRYNLSSDRYASDQGISPRINCPVYLSVKAQVLAIESGISEGVDGDYFVDNFMHMFRDIRCKSRGLDSVWDNPRYNLEFPSVFSFLLYEILKDMQFLLASILRRACDEQELGMPLLTGKIASIWVACVVDLARTKGHVSDGFVLTAVNAYMVFVLQLKHAPRELLFKRNLSGNAINSALNRLTSEMRNACKYSQNENLGTAIQIAFDQLDTGKEYVFKQKDWFAEQLEL
ncbi:hypothetical protein SAMN02745165_01737 [Malonomonas rubra DSM 5091]|uniref:Uncharacterized protein n=1 Tax=Malonomonas rubra DSM 5091 TaxID=1122189 RepID=A0A1M6H926_MALRU|nr:hypothetical protein [Malonomonas rubra]SHJ18655.1 hypothetical protein SAMN02745165_01737 [Malonomonas rubra DSM 5091]